MANIKIVDFIKNLPTLISSWIKLKEYDSIEKDRKLTRTYLETANYAEAEGLGKVAKYLRKKSKIIKSTSINKKI